MLSIAAVGLLLVLVAFQGQSLTPACKLIIICHTISRNSLIFVWPKTNYYSEKEKSVI